MLERNKIEEINRIKDIRCKIMAHYKIKFKKDYANKLGYRKQAYYKIEKTGANANYLKRIHAAFGIPADSILEGTKCYLD